MKWRVLVVDDEPAGRDRLVDLCAEAADLEVLEPCASVEEARVVLDRGDADILFLDVRMPGGDGFEALAGLSPERRPVVIFVTAHAGFALRAFEERAVDYLLKPVDRDRFHEAVRRAIDQAAAKRQADFAEHIVARLAARHVSGAAERPARFAVRSAGRVSFLKLDEVEWLDAAGNSVRVHAGDTVHRVRETMGAIQRQLDPGRFARIHRSTIVNLEKVSEVLVNTHGDYVVVTDRGQRLTVGRAYRDRIQELLRRAGTAEPTEPTPVGASA